VVITTKLSGWSGGTFRRRRSFGYVIVGRGLRAQPVIFYFGMQRLKRSQRKENPVIVGIFSAAKYRLNLCYCADHLKQSPVDINFFAQRTLERKQFLCRIVAEHDDRGAPLVVSIGEPSSRGHWKIVNILHGSGIAFENSVLHFPILIFHSESSHAKFRTEEAQSSTHGFYVRQLLHRFLILECQFLARAHFFAEAPKTERLQVISKDDVRANAGDDVAHIVVEAASDRRNADDHGDANHDSEHGKRRPHLVAADGVGRHLHDLAEFVSAIHVQLSNFAIE
jgi:hypothetical protein